MMIMKEDGFQAAMARKQWQDVRVIYVASFVVFLVAAFVAQALRLDWRSWFPGSEGDRPMIDGVKAAVSNFMPYLD
jgi:light-harvesting complex 1 beta chain